MFCFMIKDECKLQECIAWKNDECIFTKFLEKSIEHIEIMEGVVSDYYMEKSIEDTHTKMNDEIEIIKENDIEVINITPSEDLTIELVEFMENAGHYYRIDHEEEKNFWVSKGIKSEYTLPNELYQKIKNVKKLASDILTNNRETELNKEKEEIPNLADLCIEWARSQGMKSVVTRPTMEAFLTEKDIDLFYESKTMLYNLANMKSKIK